MNIQCIVYDEGKGKCKCTWTEMEIMIGDVLKSIITSKVKSDRHTSAVES